ncbi:MAG: translocation/assembly module TamB [Gemmatimonadales bacterium]|nr:MAG: translocation/assembly module TamB [Gemmatimonadales bacterium]
MEEEPRTEERKRRRGLQALAWFGGGLALLLLAGAALAFWLLQSEPGQNWVLRTALGQTDRFVDGEVAVGGIRSAGLLRGFTLEEVAIRDPAGRPLLEADSVRVGYSVRGLLRGDVVISPAELWRPRFVLETLHGDEASNLQRVFRPLLGPEDEVDPEAPEEEPRDEEDDEVMDPADEVDEPSTLQVSLRRVRVRDGSVVIRSPLPQDTDPEAPPEGMVVEALPDMDGLYRRMSFQGIDARLRRADLLDPERDGERFVFDHLEGTGQVLVDAFRVDGFRGELRRTATGLQIEARELVLPGSTLSGEVGLEWGGEELALDVDATARTLDLADFRWIEPRLPSATGSLAIRGEGPVTGGSWQLSDLDLEVEGQPVTGRVGLDLVPALAFTDSELEMGELDLALLEPWLEEPLPVTGTVAGRFAFSGPLDRLLLDADARWTEDGQTLAAEVGGTLLLDGEEPGVRDGRVRMDPLDWALVTRFLPDVPFRGSGSALARLDGRLSEGMLVELDAVHQLDGGPSSRVFLDGEVLVRGEEVRLDMGALLDPLETDEVVQALELDLQEVGTLRGSLRADGWLRDLQVAGRLDAAGGTLAFGGRTDMRDPAAGYALQVETEGFDLRTVLDGLPDPTELRGMVEVEGRSFDLESLEASATMDLSGSRVGESEVDAFSTRLRASAGRLVVDTLALEAPFIRVDGSGDLALRADGVPDGEIRAVWSVDELASLGPAFFGDTLSAEAIAADTLTDFDRQILVMEGVDPDTLPGVEAARMAGRASGELVLSGSLEDLTGRGSVVASSARWNGMALDSARVEVEGRRTVADTVEAFDLRADALLEGVSFDRWSFDRIQGGGRWDGSGGDADFTLARGEDEEIRVAGAFAHGDDELEVQLSGLEARVDGDEWRLARTAGIRLEGPRLQLSDLEVRREREDADPVRIRIDGVVDRAGDSDAVLEVRNVELDRIGALLQLEAPPSGVLDLTVRLDGPAEAPILEGDLVLLDLLWDGIELDEIRGGIDYGDRRARVRLDIDEDGQRLLTATGTWPVDLALVDVEDRFPDREVDIELLVEDLPAATILAFLEDIDRVEGRLDGRIVLRGEPSDLRPSGSLSLSDGALRIAEIGLAPSGIQAEFTVESDGTVGVVAEARSRGRADVRGTIDLSELANPAFDLEIETRGFQAVDRRDLEGRIGGLVRLSGRFDQPRVTGNVQVEQGTLFLEEFARTAEVVDLTDPRFFDFSTVDTMLVAVQPAVEAAQNPFMDNLVVDVDLRIQRDFWLRSREMNVEMQGNLDVNFDRPNREIVLLGNMTALRGNYVAFGRQFQVRDGTVEFQGTPGINPLLDIRAVHRLRREGGEPLDIIATVEGPLLNLNIGLESEAQPPIAESDLISYLVFGRPSHALASGQSSALQDAAGAGLSVGIGTLATQLSALVGRQIGLDYFAITQSQEAGRLGVSEGFSGTFQDTEVELGQYITDDLFLALVLRPLQGLGGARAQIPGARLEWRFSETWLMEAYVEDRFGREAGFTFGDPGLSLARVLGLEMWRDWGY